MEPAIAYNAGVKLNGCRIIPTSPKVSVPIPL